MNKLKQPQYPRCPKCNGFMQRIDEIIEEQVISYLSCVNCSQRLYVPIGEGD